MENIITTICKTVIGVAAIIAWTFTFIFLIMIGLGIWGLLWMLFTAICLIVLIPKTMQTKKYKNLCNTINEHEKRLSDIEREQMVNKVMRENEKK